MEKIFIRLCNFRTRTPGSIPRSIPKSSLRLSFPPYIPPKTPQEQGKRDQHTRFPPCVSLALPLDPTRRVPQPSRPPPPNESLKMPSTKGLKRSYRERTCALTENAPVIIPRASRRSYRQRRSVHTKSIKTHTESVTVGPEVRPLMTPRGALERILVLHRIMRVAPAYNLIYTLGVTLRQSLQCSP